MGNKTIIVGVVILFCNTFMMAQEPEPNYYEKQVSEFFNQKKPEVDQFKEFTDVFEIVFLDTANLEPIPQQYLDSIIKTDKERGRLAEEWNMRGGFIHMTPKETEVRFMDEKLRNLSINKYQHILTDEVHKKLGRKVRITLQYYNHWSGKIAGVKLIRFSSDTPLTKKDVIDCLKSIDYSETKTLPARHFNIAVTSVDTIVLGFE